MIIAIAGKAGSGKSTLAQMLAIQTHGEIHSIADGIKKIAKSIFLWDGHKDDKGRKLLQDIGKTARGYCEQFWINELRHSIQECLHLDKAVIIDDVRLPYEMREIFYMDKPVIFIKVEGRGMYKEGDKLGEDETEQDLDDSLFDHIVNNDGDKEKLFKIMMEILANEGFGFPEEGPVS